MANVFYIACAGGRSAAADVVKLRRAAPSEVLFNLAFIFPLTCPRSFSSFKFLRRPEGSSSPDFCLTVIWTTSLITSSTVFFRFA